MTLPIVYAAMRLFTSMLVTLPKLKFTIPPDPSTALGLPPGTVTNLESWVANLRQYVEQRLTRVKPVKTSPCLYRVCKDLFKALGFNDSVSSSLTSLYEHKLAVLSGFPADTRVQELVTFLNLVFEELLGEVQTKKFITWTPLQIEDPVQFVNELLKRKDYPDDYLSFETACLTAYGSKVDADLNDIIQRLRSLYDLINSWMGYTVSGEPLGRPISRPQLCQALELYLGLKNYPQAELEEVNPDQNGSLTATWWLGEREFKVDFEKGVNLEVDPDAKVSDDED